MFHMSPFNCHKSLTPTATVTDPPQRNTILRIAQKYREAKERIQNRQMKEKEYKKCRSGIKMKQKVARKLEEGSLVKILSLAK